MSDPKWFSPGVSMPTDSILYKDNFGVSTYTVHDMLFDLTIYIFI